MLNQINGVTRRMNKRFKIPDGCTHYPTRGRSTHYNEAIRYMKHPKDDKGSWLTTSNYDKATKHSDSWGTAIDIGAHIGMYAHKMVQDFQKVIAFEPIHHELLKENVPEAEIYPFALTCVSGNRKGGDGRYKHALFKGGETATMCYPKPGNSGSWEIIQELTPPSNHMEKREVALSSLDEWDFTDVDFVKIDAQGCEFEILKGGKKLFTDNSPVVLMEVKYRGRWDFKSIGFLAYLGYQVKEVLGADIIMMK